MAGVAAVAMQNMGLLLHPKTSVAATGPQVTESRIRSNLRPKVRRQLRTQTYSGWLRLEGDAGWMLSPAVLFLKPRAQHPHIAGLAL